MSATTHHLKIFKPEDDIPMVKHLKFYIGETVSFKDRYNTSLLPRKGTVIGFDHTPPPSTKRGGLCFVIRPHDNGPSEWREESEIAPDK